MFFPITRVVTMVMFGAICFALLLPLALARHNAVLAAGVVAIFIIYLAANVALWLRLKRRS